MEEDKDNIYNLYTEEESDESPDDSGPNYAQADHYCIEESPSTDKVVERECPNLFWLLVKVLLSPVEGWKSLRRHKVTPEEMQSKCFLPLVAFMALSQFSELFYSVRTSLASVVENSVIDFVSFFFGYFIIIIILRMVMPKITGKSLDTTFGKVFVLMSLSTLCVFYSLTQLLPMLWAILIFLPLWTVYVMCKGTRFFVFPETRQITCTGILCLVVIGVPMLIDWSLLQLLPNIQ